MLTRYHGITAAERERTRDAAPLLHAAAETAMAEGRWRREDFNEHVLAVAREHRLHVWPWLLVQLRTAVSSAPSTA